MRSFLVRCATGLSPARRERKPKQYDERIELRISPDKEANVRLQVDNIESRIIQDFSPVVLDLLELASYLYVADKAISRGRQDPFGKGWYRDIELVVPVREQERWESVREDLEELLTFLSGDARIRLRFQRYSGKRFSGQRYIGFPAIDAGYKGAHTVVLFSGGIDSLAGAIREISSGRVPLLVSHRSAPTRASHQKVLIKQLQGAAKDKVYGLSMWINQIGRGQADVSQRLRSFLYLSLAFAVAKELGIHRILYCENGISSFNLPLSADRIGSRSSRTTNPRVLDDYQRLISRVLDHEAKVENPFLFLSKADVMEEIVKSGRGNLIADAVTCGRTIRAARGSPNCGTCYQCTMRRFATEQRGLQGYDPLRVYAKDLFAQELKEGEERSTPVQWVGFHNKIGNLKDEDFEIEFPETSDFYDYLPGDKGESLQKMFSLYRRNAEEVQGVLKRKLQDYFGEFMSGELPPHCLLSLIGVREHLVGPVYAYAVRIAGIAEVALRRTYADHPPDTEVAVQNQLEIVLEAAGERLHREYPTLVFSIVKTRPDFSSIDGRLYIEVKLLKDRRYATRLVDALVADREKYTTAGASVLFLVYQTSSFIADSKEFADSIIRDDVFCKVIG